MAWVTFTINDWMDLCSRYDDESEPAERPRVEMPGVDELRNPEDPVSELIKYGSMEMERVIL